MCMEDVRLGRESRSDQRDLTVGAASVNLCSASKSRTVLIVSPPTAGSITVSLEQTAVLGSGINLATTSPPLMLTIGTHGDLPTRQWSVIADAPGRLFAVYETHLMKE